MEWIAIIIAALITVGGSLLTYWLTIKSNTRIKKLESQEKFFYQIFSKRLSLYEDIALWHNSLEKECNKGDFFFEVAIKTLLSFEIRSSLYGTEELSKLIKNLRQGFEKANTESNQILSTLKDKPLEFQAPLLFEYLKHFTEKDLQALFDYIKTLPYIKHMDKVQSEIIN